MPDDGPTNQRRSLRDYGFHLTWLKVVPISRRRAVTCGDGSGLVGFHALAPALQ